MQDDRPVAVLGAGLAGLVARFTGASVQRSELAYPQLLREYEDDRVTLARGAGIEGL